MYEVANDRQQLQSFGELNLVVRQHRPDPDGAVVGEVEAGLDVSAAEGRLKLGKRSKGSFDCARGDVHVFHRYRNAVRRVRFAGSPQRLEARS